MEQERLHREQLNRPPSQREDAPSKQEPAVPKGTCFPIKQVILTGATLLDASEKKAVTAPFEGRCLTLDEIDNLIKAVTNKYIEKGYVTTRAGIPAQDMSDGILEIIVVEGRVEEVSFTDEQAGKPEELAMAFPDIENAPLNLRDIEQGIDQMNRLPSNSVRMKLVPGSKPGTSRVLVDKKSIKTWRATIGLNNSGQDSTGRNQYSLSFEKDNLANLNDLLSVYANADAKALTNGNRHRSESLSAYYSVPHGYWTYSANWSYFDYRTSITGGTATYSSSGKTRTFGASAERVIHRDKVSKTSLGGSFRFRETQNYLAGVKLDASSYLLSSLGFSLSHARRAFGGSLSGNVEYRKGIPAFGSGWDSSHSRSTPRYEFEKITFSGSFYRPIPLENCQLSWSTRLFGQWSPDTMFDAERISIGSRYSVRGFQDESLSGDIGGYVRNELALTPDYSPDTSQSLRSWLGKAQFYTGYDAGFIHEDKRDEEERGTLQGAVLGLRTIGGTIRLDLAVAHPLDAPSFMQTNPLEYYASFKIAF
ncbi:two-partner secretion system transporter TpsB1 [Salidesulfovibrio brasiliensis]